jgi:hypothetical protein
LCKNKNWKKYKEETIKQSKFHKLCNGMVRNGKMFVGGNNLSDMKQKKPTIGKSLEETKEKWFKFMGDKFMGDDDSNKDEEWNENSKQAIDILIPREIVKFQLSKTKNNSSPGISGISWKMLKFIYSKDSDFIVGIVNDIVNNKIENVDIFCEMIVLPIFKSNKKGISPSECSSFRCINLSEVLIKLVEGC